ncbi:hypothetical protein L1887_48204 [Cichorium endivia]|nr:hypothetical protein L1887_48204 [Cichorium endivia]
MSKRMQNLIMEILQAQPSLRDSKTYLNSFAPRKAPPRKPPAPLQPGLSEHTSISTAPSHSQPSEHHPEFPLPPNVVHPGSLHNPSTTTWDPKHSISLETDPHAIPPASADTKLPKSIRDLLQQGKLQVSVDHADAPSTSAAPQPVTTQESSTVAIPQVTPVSDALADSHTALVKVQGPFTDRQLDSIAEGLIYLKRLGLVSVVVVDQDDWPEISANIDRNGQLVAGSDEVEEQRMGDWLAAHPAPASANTKGKQKAREPCRSSMLGRKQERLRKRIMAETLRLADSLNRKGAMARPFPQAVVRVDARAAAAVEAEVRSFQHSQPTGAAAPGDTVVAGSSSTSPTVHYGSAGEQRLRPPLVSDDGLTSIRSALASDQIPVLAPYALFENEIDGTLETLCVRADDVMVALARDMVVAANNSANSRIDNAATCAASSSTGADPLSELAGGEVDMMPLRLMVINREGGIPSHARGGDPHLSINLASEYHQIKHSFGVGLLDALNDNGGRGGYGTGRDLVWKSRANNPVNRWYYERSNGFVRIDTDANGTGWQLFWCDAEDKLARLSGERRLSASASNLEEAAAIAHDNVNLRHSLDDDAPGYARGPFGERTGIEAYERSRRLSKPQFDSRLHRGSLSMESGSGGRTDLTLLPIVAPEEGGRLLRWAKCMKTIKGVWAD